MTADDAARYFHEYEQAIHAIGKAAGGRGIYEGPGISIKLSALHPRYCRAQRERVMGELLPRLRALAVLARRYDIGLNIDAEEADRLELSLDLLEALVLRRGSGGLERHWLRGAGLSEARALRDRLSDRSRAPQWPAADGAAGERCLLGQRNQARAAGWAGGVSGLHAQGPHRSFPISPARGKLLAAPDAVFPQFATHNAQTLAAIHTMAGPDFHRGQYEFQCLHGMGEPLYEEVVGADKLDRPCRIYAPVGTHRDVAGLSGAAAAGERGQFLVCQSHCRCGGGMLRR